MAVIWQSPEYVGHASVRTPGILIERRRLQRVNSSGLRLLLLLTDRAPLEVGYHPQVLMGHRLSFHHYHHCQI